MASIEWLEYNSEIKNGIKYKVQNILKVPFEIKNKGNVETQLIREMLENPEVGKTLNDMIENYYFGLLFDGEVHWIKTDDGFVVARKKEVSVKDGFITYKSNKHDTFYTFENKNPATQKVEPEYKEISLELQEKFYSQSNNIKLLKRGLVIREVFSSDKVVSESERLSFLDKLRQRFSLSTFNNVDNVRLSQTSGEEGTSLFLNGSKLNYSVNNASLGDIQNTTLASKNSDKIYNFIGVPPQLMGSDSSSTYNNYKTANIAFLQNTVIPEAKKICNMLNLVLFDGEKVIVPNFEREYALIDEKEKNFNMLYQIYNSGGIDIEELMKNSGFEYILNERKGVEDE